MIGSIGQARAEADHEVLIVQEAGFNTECIFFLNDLQHNKCLTIQ